MKAVVFNNPRATNAQNAEICTREALDRFGVLDRHVTYIDEPARADHLEVVAKDKDSAKYLVFSHGGDATTGMVLAAIAGIRPTNRNPMIRSNSGSSYADDVVGKVLFFAGAGGNANMWAKSATGNASSNPKDLGEYQVGYHQPLTFSLYDDDGTLIASDSASTCFGIGATANVASEIEYQKPRLNGLSGASRLIEEAKIAIDGTLNAPPIDLVIDGQRKDQMTGIELIGVRKYAKIARTGVNVDDPNWQILTGAFSNSSIASLMRVTSTSIRGIIGRYKDPVIDLSERGLRIDFTNYTGSTRFHADGEVRHSMYPGQYLYLSLSKIAVPVVVTK